MAGIRRGDGQTRHPAELAASSLMRRWGTITGAPTLAIDQDAAADES
jgi:hypothetical protein